MPCNAPRALRAVGALRPGARAPPGSGGGEVSAGERAGETATLVPLAEGAVVITAEGKRYDATVPPRVRLDDTGNVLFDLTFKRPAAVGVRTAYELRSTAQVLAC